MLSSSFGTNNHPPSRPLRHNPPIRYLRLAALDKVLRENVVANLEEEGACPDDGAKIRNSLHWRDSRRDRGVGESSGTDGKLQPVGAAPSIGEN